jgi:hypothetical protein
VYGRVELAVLDSVGRSSRVDGAREKIAWCVVRVEEDWAVANWAMAHGDVGDGSSNPAHADCWTLEIV